MRVTVVCSVYPPAKVAESAHAEYLCRHLARAGCEVTLITSRAADGPQPHDPEFRIRPVMAGWRWRDVPRLRRELKASRPEAVLLIYIGPIYNRHPMVTYLPSLCRRLSPRPRVVTQFENTQGADLRSFGERAGRKLAARLAGGPGLEYRYGTLLRDSDVVVTLCEPHLAVLEEMRPGVRAKSVVIPAPPLIDLVDDPDGSVRERMRARLGFGPDDFVLTFFGYIYPEKGVETVLAAAAKAAASVPNLRLLMIGGSPVAADPRDPSYGDRMKKLADDLGLTGRTTWTGFVDGVENGASAHLHAVDAVMMPFSQGIRMNNSSYAVVSSHGLPVITTRGGTLEAEFRDRDNVLLFPLGDADAAAARVAEVATDPALRAALREGSLAFSRGRSSWPAVVRQTIDVLRPNGVEGGDKSGGDTSRGRPPANRLAAAVV